MKPKKLFSRLSNKNFELLISDKFIKKIHNESYNTHNKSKQIKILNKNSLNKRKDLILKKNNITINNSINNIINNITINTNHASDRKHRFLMSNNSKSKGKEEENHILDNKKNIRKNFISFIKDNGISRNKFFRNINYNISNNSFNHLSFNNKILNNPSFNKNKTKKESIMPKKINKRNKNYNFITNKSLYTNSINTSINEGFKKNVNISLNLNKFTRSLRLKFFDVEKDNLKKKEMEKKIQNIFNGINKNKKIIPSIINISKGNIKIVNAKKNNKSQLNNNIINHTFLIKNKSKTTNNFIDNKKNLNKKITSYNAQKNNFNIIKNFQRNNNYNRNINHLTNENKTFLKIIFKDNRNITKTITTNTATNNDNLDNNIKNSIPRIKKNEQIINLKQSINNIINKRDKKRETNSSLNNTIKFSQYTSKIEDEGELGLDEVQDIIIYYRMNNELLKDYLFKNNDYFHFIQKGRKKYYNFFMK